MASRRRRASRAWPFSSERSSVAAAAKREAATAAGEERKAGRGSAGGRSGEMRRMRHRRRVGMEGGPATGSSLSDPFSRRDFSPPLFLSGALGEKAELGRQDG